MCFGGSKTTSATTPTNAAIQPALTQEVQQAQSLANQPLQQYTGQLVAPLTADQNTGISDIENAQGLAQPDLTAAQSLATQGTAPITTTPFSQSAVNQYESPYTADVLNTTEAAETQQDQQQQQSLAGNITAAGAFGGDRSAVVQSELAGQQALANNETNANIENTGYDTALGQFNTENQLGVQTQEANDQNAEAGAYSLANIGTSMENTALTGGSALLNAGTAQQQVNQENLNVPYEEYLQQQAYPYQSLDFESGILGNAAGTGGTTSTSSTSTPFGTSLLGALKDGGRARLAGGGLADTFEPLPSPPSMSSFIPSASTSGSRGLTAGGGGSGRTGGSGGNTGNNPVKSAINNYAGSQITSGLNSAFGSDPLATVSVTPEVTSTGGFLGGSGNSGFFGLSGTGGLGSDISSAASSVGGGLTSLWDALKKGGRTHLDDGGNSSPPQQTDQPLVINPLDPGELAYGGRTRLDDGGDSDGSYDPDYPDGDPSAPPPVTEDDKDPHPEVDHSGDTTVVRYADGTTLDTGIPTEAATGGPTGASAMSQADTPPEWQDQATNYATPPGGQSLAATTPTWDDGTPVTTAPLPQEQSGDSWGGGLSRPARVLSSGYTPPSPDIGESLLTGLGSALEHRSLGYGLGAGILNYYDQQHANNNPTIDNSGPTQVAHYANTGVNFDTGRPTEAAINAKATSDYRNTNMDTIAAERQAATQQRADAAAAAVAERAQAAKDAVAQRAQQEQDANANRQAQIKIAGIQAGGSWTYAGVDPKTNMPVLLNNRTGETKLGNAPIAAKPAAGDIGLPTATGASPGAPGNPGANVHGDAYLQTLPAAVQPVVKAMVEGRQPPPTSFAMSKPYWQQMIQAANQYDPGFDQTTWPSRVATRRSFTAGPDANNITAIDTALQHAGVVQNSLGALHNGSIPALNTAENWMKEAFGNSAPTNAHEAVDALASEGRKVFAGTGGGNLTELENWQKNFPVNGSPQQQSGALAQFVNLLDSRMDALADKYSRGMGNSQDKLNFLSPNARAVYTRLTGRGPVTAPAGASGTPASLAAPAAAAPNHGPTEGAIYKDAQGNRAKYVNGQYVPVP